MTSRLPLSQIPDLLRGARSIAVTSHVMPDGDAIGSALGLTRLLQSMGKGEVTRCVFADPVPDIYAWLPMTEAIIAPDAITEPPEWLVLVDASRKERMGDVARLLEGGTRFLVMDHHADPTPDGDCVYMDTNRAAVGEIILDLFALADVPLDAIAATCLYVALATDTGGFRFSNTTRASHEAAARLLEAGIDAAEINRRIFDSMSRERFNLMAHILSGIEFHYDGALACATVTLDDLAKCGGRFEELTNTMNMVRGVHGVKVAALLREVSASESKLSLRALPGFDCVAAVAIFGGGGHPCAAGATIKAPIVEAKKILISHLAVFTGGSA